MEPAMATPPRSAGFPDWMALAYGIAAAGAFAFWAALVVSFGAQLSDPLLLTNMLAGPLTAVIAAFALCRSRVAGAALYFLGSAIIVVWWLANLSQDRGWVAPAVLALPMSLLGIRGLATHRPKPGDPLDNVFWPQVAMAAICLAAFVAGLVVGGFGMKLAADAGLVGPMSTGPNPMAATYRDEAYWYIGYAVAATVAFAVSLRQKLRRSIAAPIFAGGGAGLAAFAILRCLR